MQDVVPGFGHDESGELVQFTLPPLVAFVVPEVNDVGVVPKREMVNP
jgi:hypothetical protein